MKATLTFNLPEDETDLKIALDAPKWISLVVDYDNHLRNLTKHHDHTEEVHDAYQHSRNKLHQLLNEYELNPFE